MMDFYTLTKVRKGVYEGLTPHGTDFLVLTYSEGSKSKTRWAVCAPGPAIREPATPTASALDATAEVIPSGWAIASIDHNTRYQARIWAEANLR